MPSARSLCVGELQHLSLVLNRCFYSQFPVFQLWLLDLLGSSITSVVSHILLLTVERNWNKEGKNNVNGANSKARQDKIF